MKITFLGDIMCELPVLKAAKRETGYDFSGVFAPSKKLLAKSDFVIGNQCFSDRDSWHSNTEYSLHSQWHSE